MVGRSLVWICRMLVLQGIIGIAHEVECATTAGNFTITLQQSWSPLGVQRFLELVDDSFFDNQIFYRVIPGFLTQFGVAADPKMQSKWDRQRIKDEPKKSGFKHGTVSFAGNGLDSRSCHIFIAFGPNCVSLGSAPHETALGEVTRGLFVLDTLQANYRKAGYGDLTHLQGELAHRGNVAAEQYPKLDRILTCERKDSASVAQLQPAPFGGNPDKVEMSFALDAGLPPATRAQIFWVNPRNEEIPNGELMPGATVPVSTFHGHRFRFRINGAITGELVVDKGKGISQLHSLPAPATQVAHDEEML